jgi:hypothetical protein
VGKVKRFPPTPSRIARSLLRLAQAPPSAAEEPTRTLADAIAQALFRKALKGDAAAVKEITDRIEGPAVCPKCGGVNQP